MQKLAISQSGLDLIRRFESFSAMQYTCPAGKPTIGYGHVLRPSENLTRVSLDQADRLLLSDCRIVENYLNGINLPEALNQNEFDALVSLAFNIGLGNFERSTLLKRLREGDKPRAADQFLAWNKVRRNGELVFSKGLHRRRCMERELFLRVVA